MTTRVCPSVLCLLLLTTGCAVGRAARDQQELATWMGDSFSSAAQHAADPDNFFDIRLQMAPIWQHRHDGPWLYVEQAAADRWERPYRQRVYHLFLRDDGALESAVYTLPGDPLRYAGAWRDVDPLANLEPDDLIMRNGCSIILADISQMSVARQRCRAS
jgi:CpeT protein